MEGDKVRGGGGGLYGLTPYHQIHTVLSLDEALASRTVFVIVSGSERAGGTAFGTS